MIKENFYIFFCLPFNSLKDLPITCMRLLSFGQAQKDIFFSQLFDDDANIFARLIHHQSNLSLRWKKKKKKNLAFPICEWVQIWHTQSISSPVSQPLISTKISKYLCLSTPEKHQEHKAPLKIITVLLSESNI